MNIPRVNFITLARLNFMEKMKEHRSITNELVPRKGEGNSAGQEEIETFIQEQKSKNTDVCPLILENIDGISHIVRL